MQSNTPVHTTDVDEFAKWYASDQMVYRQGGHKLGEKNSLTFPGFSRSIITLLQRLLQQIFFSQFGSDF